jgi:hypothetical protein
MFNVTLELSQDYPMRFQDVWTIPTQKEGVATRPATNSRSSNGVDKLGPRGGRVGKLFDY